MDKRLRSEGEGSDMESCLLGADAYPESTQVCAQEICMVCEDGKWLELEDEPEE